MTMLTIGFRRGLAAALAGAVLLIGALACAAGSDNAATASLTSDLKAVEKMSQDNFVQLEVLEARIDRLEGENSQLSGRIAQLEEDKQALLDVVTSLAALAPGGADLLTGAAALAGGIMSQTSNEPLTRDTATEEQRALVRRWAECSLKSSGTMSESLVKVAIDPSVDVIWEEIENGDRSFSEIEATIDVMCSSR